MKIKEEIKTYGDFWLPAAPDRKVHGTLSISNERGIELEIFQALEGNMESLLNRNMCSFNRVVGDVEEYGYVTLDGCQYTRKSHSLGQDVKARGILRVDRVFTHVKYDENESPRFNTFTFSIEGIDEWVSADGIRIAPGPEEGTESYYTNHLRVFHWGLSTVCSWKLRSILIELGPYFLERRE